jgi:hypothetical protein
MAKPSGRKPRPPAPTLKAVPVGRNGNTPDPPEGAEVRMRRRRTPVFNLFLILAAAAIVIPVLITAFFYFAGLGPFASDLFPVTLQNDGTAAVVIKDCGTNCTAADAPYTLDPGTKVQVAASDQGLVTFYLHDASGAVTGCLPLEFHRKVSGVIINTSRAETCPGAPITG